MTASASSLQSSTSALQKEQILFNELFIHLGNAFLNRIFDLRPDKAVRRMWYLLLLFFVSVFLISLNFYPPTLWSQFIQDIFLYSLNPDYAASYIGNPFANFFGFISQVSRDPRIFRYFPIFLVPFFVALQAAALYLADIFELERVSVASSFILEVSLLGSDETILITQGDISDEHRQSANYLIGGPGKVIVDLDSVALFEKADGTPHIIGPTGKEPGGKAILIGFERFRQAINLRDHLTNLPDQEEKSKPITSRSLDGIPVFAVDVQMVYSIDRDGKKPTAEFQYPFSEKAVEKLIYSATSKVTPDSKESSEHVFIWENSVPAMVRGELIKFISEKNLTQYLASFGLPEVRLAEDREDAIVEQELQIIPPFEKAPTPKSVSQPPQFTPRHEISNLFSQFATSFTEKVHKKGVELHWIGIGTWKTPIENVSEMHFEAWKLTRENMIRGKKESIEKKGKEVGFQKIISMIKEVPLDAYQDILQESKNGDLAAQSLLREYLTQLRDVKEFLHKNTRRIPPTLVAAVFYLYRILTPSHSVYSNLEPTPVTVREKQIYHELLKKIGFFEVVVQLIEFEKRFNPEGNLEEWLERVNLEWDLDIKQ